MAPPPWAAQIHHSVDISSGRDVLLSSGDAGGWAACRSEPSRRFISAHGGERRCCRPACVAPVHKGSNRTAVKACCLCCFPQVFPAITDQCVSRLLCLCVCLCFILNHHHHHPACWQTIPTRACVHLKQSFLIKKCIPSKLLSPFIFFFAICCFYFFHIALSIIPFYHLVLFNYAWQLHI